MKNCFKYNFDLNLDDNKVLTPVNEVKSNKDIDARSMSADSNYDNKYNIDEYINVIKQDRIKYNNNRDPNNDSDAFIKYNINKCTMDKRKEI